jgi:hypothetical protein
VKTNDSHYYLKIPPGIGNKYLSEFYIDFPTGIVNLEGVCFHLEHKSLVFDTGSHIRHYYPVDNNGKEVRLKLPEPITGISAAYFLINSGNSKEVFESEKIGEIILCYEGGLEFPVDLVLGKNIREWRIGSSGDYVRKHSDLNSKLVWQGFSTDGTNAIMDCLEMNIPDSNRNNTLDEIRFVHHQFQKSGDTLGPQYFISGITLELGDDEQEKESFSIMEISEANRREIIDSLLLSDIPFSGNLGLIEFLERIWDLSSMPSTDNRFDNAGGDIFQHMILNDDWNEYYLLNNYLDLLSCDDERFLEFLEQTLHPIIGIDEPTLSRRIEIFNAKLATDGYKLDVISHLSERPIYQARKISSANSDNRQLKFDIALSYAGEDREYVEEVAAYLNQQNVKFFYDKYEEANLWGEDLAEHLDDVFRISSKYCVMFISEFYERKVWPTYERKCAISKAIQEKSVYILPVRFDETEIPGLNPNIVYLNANEKTPEEIGQYIIKKYRE